MDERWVRAVVTAAIWVVVIVVVRWVLRRAYDAWERRQTDADPRVVARRRTTFSFLLRIAVALVAVVGAWSVLSIFPQTETVARALLASSAVLALFAGLALSTPLGNFGSGVLVAFTQPIRIGDRATVGEHTGFVESINLIYTTLVTDDAKRIFLPNTQLTTGPVVNRTIRDPRRSVNVALPVRLDAPLGEARRLLLAASEGTVGVLESRVAVTEATERTVWLSVTAFAPLDADVASVGSDIRENGLSALGAAGLLP